METLLESGLVVPGELRGVGRGLETGMIVNESELPDQVVQQAVETYFEENASLLGLSAGMTAFRLYASDAGSLLERARFRAPSNIFDEIALSRSLGERDDDVGSAMGVMAATAFCDGMQNTATDEDVVALYDEVAQHTDLDMVFQELYREWLIASQVTTMCAWTRESFQYTPPGSDRQRTRSLVAPFVGTIPAEQIRINGTDSFRTGIICFKPSTATQEAWLSQFFSPYTTPARKAEMRREDPVLTSLLIEELDEEDPNRSTFYEDSLSPPTGRKVYRCNPMLVGRSSAPKGNWKYPRPIMTRNFALLEAKRLLNLLDHALLQGGINFLVVAKKGSDQRPALPDEVANLHETIARASRSGVIVGDHRLSIEIITPNMDSVLNPDKRKLVGRKLAMSLLRVPEHMTDNPAAEGMRAEVDFISRVITLDRRTLMRHVQKHVYKQVERRNANVPGKASILFPKIVLQGTQAFTDYVLKLRDRGDIPRQYAVEAAGFDYKASVATRRREKANGDDKVLTAPPVPFSAPGPQDNGGGRPAGGSPNNGLPGARQGSSTGGPTRVVHQNAGETVRAMFEEGVGTYRIGELTHAILDEFAQEGSEWGRLTQFEKQALARLESEAEWPGQMIEGPICVVPVNPAYEIAGVRAIALAPGLRMLIGRDVETDAMVARAFAFREPQFKALDGEETALRWGFPVRPALPPGDE